MLCNRYQQFLSALCLSRVSSTLDFKRGHVVMVKQHVLSFHPRVYSLQRLFECQSRDIIANHVILHVSHVGAPVP